MLLSANAAFAATTVIGSAVADSYVCPGGYDTVQLSWSSGTYAVPPGGGAITSWSTSAGPGAGQVGLQVWRPIITVPPTVPSTYLLVGASPLVTPLTPSAPNTITLLTPIPVQAGDLIGLRIQDPAYCQATLSVTDIYGSKVVPTNPALGAIDTFATNKWYQLDVAATVDATVITPPPPSGCDSTNNSATSQTDTSNGDSTGNSAHTVADTSASVARDASTAARADTSNVDSTDRSTKDSSDQSTKDSSDQSKKDKPAKDQSTGGDNCQQ